MRQRDKFTKQRDMLERRFDSIFKPAPSLSGSEWADKFFYLSEESAAMHGKWKTRPWQKDIIDAMTDQRSNIVAIKKPTRVGFTKALTIAHAFFIHQQPAVQLHYQPTTDEARGYAEDELEPMIRDNIVIKELVETPNTRGRVKKEKTVKKIYPGGYIEVLGSESDRNLNRRTARIAVGDEIDTWKKEAGKAGDTITTMLRRTSDFWNRKNIIGGKPIGASYNPDVEYDDLDGVSMVDYWFKRGTQEYRHLPCPHCGFYQKFEWEDMSWDREYGADGSVKKHYPETAHFVCKKCGGAIFDKDKREMDKRGKWVAENQDAEKEKIRSFYLWAMLSYSPNVTWPDIVREFLQAKRSKLKLKAFYGEVLAKTWEDEYVSADATSIMQNREEYQSQVPDGVLILTVGADTQDDRIECEVVGWGANEESWSIEYRIFHGDTSKPEVWDQFDEFLYKSYTHANGGLMRAFCGCVDTQGHSTKQAYEFCRNRFGRKIFAIKGHTKIDAPIAPRTASRKNKGKIPLFLVGVNQAKDVIHSHIMTERPGAGYCHFPIGYDTEYFKQLTAEKRDKTGRWIKKRDRNEALDVRVYAYASLHIAGIDLELMAQRGPAMLSQRNEAPGTRPKQVQPVSYMDEF